jgi:hypothetical protein
MDKELGYSLWHVCHTDYLQCVKGCSYSVIGSPSGYDGTATKGSGEAEYVCNPLGIHFRKKDGTIGCYKEDLIPNDRQLGSSSPNDPADRPRCDCEARKIQWQPPKLN